MGPICTPEHETQAANEKPTYCTLTGNDEQTILITVARERFE